VVCTMLYPASQEWFQSTARRMLNQFLGIDVSGPALLNDDLALLNRRLDQMEAAPLESERPWKLVANLLTLPPPFSSFFTESTTGQLRFHPYCAT
jgi:hypothetical protein